MADENKNRNLASIKIDASDEQTVITITKLDKTGGRPSASGKSTIMATTSGYIQAADGRRYSLTVLA